MPLRIMRTSISSGCVNSEMFMAVYLSRYSMNVFSFSAMIPSAMAI